jgi:23S rRNA (cytosine1962-C5)-methyltransferase
MAHLPEIEISARAARRVGAGHLWIYANEIEAGQELPEPAAWCRFTRGGRTVATGYFNRHSLIAGRAVGFEAADRPEALVVRRLRESFLRRRHPATSGAPLRLVFAEADLLPGLVVDLYPPYAVVQCSTAGMDLMRAELEARIPEVYAEVFGTRLAGMVLRGDSGARRLEGLDVFRRVSFGDPGAMAEAVFEENGVRYVADLVNGQKTGFFLDQRENRRALGAGVRACPGARVLDLYCYNGGWGLRALREGAGRVTFVDRDRTALAQVEKALALNGLPRERADLVQADAFEFLAGDAQAYDAVVADPPAFVKSRKNRPQALKAYRKLNRLAWGRLAPGGVLYSCSCSHLLAEADFLDVLAEAVAREGGMAQVVYRGRQPSDHPVLLSMPETAYLKCVGLLKITAGGK